MIPLATASAQVLQCFRSPQGEDIFEISDAFHHPVFCRAPAVKMGLVFYAAAIIRAHNGTPMGTLCVLDKTPRTLTEIQRRQLSVRAKPLFAPPSSLHRASRVVTYGCVQAVGGVSPCLMLD